MLKDLRYSDMIIRDFKKEFGIDISQVIQRGILPVTEAKKWLVRELYYKWAKKDRMRTYADIKYELSIIYDISVSSIEKMIYRK
mgnify:CR=1 FL=1